MAIDSFPVTDNTVELLDECWVYWIHLPEHTDVTSEGYIGVSCNPENRYKAHTSPFKTENKHLLRSFEKYRDKIRQTLLVKGTRLYCLLIESKLRPAKNVGWNIAEGGGTPPSRKGRKHSEEHKAKIALAHIGVKKPWVAETNKRVKALALIGTHWYHDPVTKRSMFFSPDNKPNGWIKGRWSRRKIVGDAS